MSVLYTPSKVWSIMTEGSDEVEELIDVETGLLRLPVEQRTFLILLAQGYTGAQAMELSGSTGNQTRIKREVLSKLTDLINGE